MKPILKWPGGKAKLAEQIIERFPATFNRYVEPFCGAAAVWCALQPERAWLNDRNRELINLYRVLKNGGARYVRTILGAWSVSEADYLLLRSLSRPKNAESEWRAARTLYLNRYGFNGLYRVNSKGDYNVPYGARKKPVNWSRVDLEGFGKALKWAKLTSYDFESVLLNCGQGDVVYCDPPYDGGFTAYTKEGFSLLDQERLAVAATQAVRQGAHVLVSNSNTDAIRAIYRGDNLRVVEARRSISTKASSRGMVQELLIEVRP